MKNILAIPLLPFFIIGFIVGSIYAACEAAFLRAYDYWVNED